jgi:hypothetical protein
MARGFQKWTFLRMSKIQKLKIFLEKPCQKTRCDHYALISVFSWKML